MIRGLKNPGPMEIQVGTRLSKPEMGRTLKEAISRKEEVCITPFGNYQQGLEDSGERKAQVGRMANAVAAASWHGSLSLDIEIGIDGTENYPLCNIKM